MQKYVKTHGFTTPDEQSTVANVVLRTRTATGKVIGEIIPYCELFDTATDELLPETEKSAEADEAATTDSESQYV